MSWFSNINDNCELTINNGIMTINNQCSVNNQALKFTTDKMEILKNENNTFHYDTDCEERDLSKCRYGYKRRYDDEGLNKFWDCGRECKEFSEDPSEYRIAMTPVDGDCNCACVSENICGNKPYLYQVDVLYVTVQDYENMKHNIKRMKQYINNNLNNQDIVDFIIHEVQLNSLNTQYYSSGKGIYIHKYNNKIGKIDVIKQFFPTSDTILNTTALNISGFTHTLSINVKNIQHNFV